MGIKTTRNVQNGGPNFRKKMQWAQKIGAKEQKRV